MSKIHNAFIALCGAFKTKSIFALYRSYNHILNEVGIVITTSVFMPAFLYVVVKHFYDKIIQSSDNK